LQDALVNFNFSHFSLHFDLLFVVGSDVLTYFLAIVHVDQAHLVQVELGGDQDVDARADTEDKDHGLNGDRSDDIENEVDHSSAEGHFED